MAAMFDSLKRINTILIDLNRDLWTYISMDYFKQKLKEGEVAIYQPGTNTVIKFLEDESIEVITDSFIKVTAPESEVVGNVTITGHLTVTGSTTLSATVTSNGKDISDTHTEGTLCCHHKRRHDVLHIRTGIFKTAELHANSKPLFLWY